MKSFVLGAVLLLAVFAQVTVAPLFPVAGATMLFPLAVLAMMVAYGGPIAPMVATPAAAILLGFASDRSPALLLIGLLPLLPIAHVLERWEPGLPHFGRILFAGVATGWWLRGVLMAAPIVEGANFSVGAVFAQVLIPGTLLDVALLAVVYLAARLIGLRGQSLSLTQGGYWAND